MEDSIEFYAKDHPTSTCTIPLYTTPPTAAQAARQMRDAAVKVCRDDAEQCASAEQWDYEDVALDLAEAIAALPVPEIQWRDLTDDEIAEIGCDLLALNNVSDIDFARAVVAKFKEKQHAI